MTEGTPFATEGMTSFAMTEGTPLAAKGMSCATMPAVTLQTRRNKNPDHKLTQVTNQFCMAISDQGCDSTGDVQNSASQISWCANSGCAV